MKRWWTLGVLFIGAVALVWWSASQWKLTPRARSVSNRLPATQPPVTERATSIGNSKVAPENPDAEWDPASSPAVAQPSALASLPEPPAGPKGDSGIPPLTALENLRTIFRSYSRQFGGNPVGNNAEISAALNGANPREVAFISSEDGLRLNERGELVDSWSTPLFFHQLSGTQMEIRSAGGDRKLWTADDLVLR